MSLVNDMLKDLDTRKQAPANARRAGVLVNVEVEQNSLPQIIKAIIIALIVVCGLGTAFYFYINSVSDTELLDSQLSSADVNRSPSASSSLQSDVGTALPELPSSAISDIESAPEKLVATGIKLELGDFEIASDKLSLRLLSEDEIDYSIEQKTDRAMTFRVTNVAEFEMQDYNFPGLTLSRNGDEVLLMMETARDADFQLYSDSVAGNVLVLNAVYLQQTSLVDSMQENISAEVARDDPPLPEDQETVEIAVQNVEADPVAQISEQIEQVAEALAESVAEPLPQETIRRNRDLSLDQRDRNVAQAALDSFRAGRLLEAQDRLLTFINENPEAHNSRETLATILTTQKQEYQAETIVDEGLSIAPNYVAFKKLKAQLLMQRGEFIEAMELLRKLPPPLSFDTEYHVILAGLYQRNNEFGLAETAYQDLLRFNQEIANWWLGLAIAMENLNKREGAASAYRMALNKGLSEPNLKRYAQDKIVFLRAQ